jgi:hypothetical protein
MSKYHKPVISRLLRFGSAFAFTSTLAMLPAVSHANVVSICESGPITHLETPHWGNSAIRVATANSPAANWKRDWMPVVGYGTRMEYRNATRWRDRLAMLRMAYALQLPVYITSNDSNCMGADDKFSITVCRPGTPYC